MRELLDEYNSKAERVGLKNFIISHDASDSVGDDMEYFTTMIQREVRSCRVNYQ